MDTEDKAIILIVITLSLMLYLCIIGGLNLRDEYNKLKKENEKLQQENTDYKWQLEQVPYIIEYGCKGE